MFSFGIKTFLIPALWAANSFSLSPPIGRTNPLSVISPVIDSVEIISVKNVDEVLKVALTKPLKRVEWVEVDQISKKEKIKEELSTH